MKRGISRRQILAGGGIGALASLAGCLATGRGETETVTKTYRIDDLETLSLAAQNGSVTVEGNQGDAIEIRGHKAAPTESSLESLTIETSRNDGHLTVETQRDDTPFLFGPDPILDLEVTVPEGVRLARAKTVNGDVEVRNVVGELMAETTNGQIDVEGVDGTLVSESTNGSIRAADVRSDVSVNTTNGSIDVTLAADGGDLTAESTNGEITVTAPASLDAAINAAATNGEISIEGFDESDVSGRGSVSVTLDEGTRRVRLDTTNGDISVRSETVA
ncbi:DUF4097 family beta strand repeat-containing protein [Natrinema halophilum]|uniref:DUF4097 family beta strand repeat protein n=1 Tax=Natrinema halophilum TaxID=1699371 RepID=A0A7D5L3L5_9EURY|nr:DUF4097 family beta strand repeat-containing protein [Natrinema halophilum]QLG50745.1 DUF4097 domain-containing protein [Natrinema halophilum]